MYKLQDAVGWSALIYYVMVVASTMYFLFNLIVAALGGCYQTQLLKDAKAKKEKEEAEASAQEAVEFVTPPEAVKKPPPVNYDEWSDDENDYRPITLKDTLNGHTFNRFIMGMIIINTILTALQSPFNSPGLAMWLIYLNYLFSFVFAVEMGLKIQAFGRDEYLKSHFNKFDALMVLISVFDFGGGLVGMGECDENGNCKGTPFGIFRCARVLRILKVADESPRFHKVLTVILHSLKAVAPMIVLLFLFICIFAVLGLHMFGGIFEDWDEKPRAHFDDVLISFMSVFIVVTSDNWADMMLYTYKG